MEARCGNGLPLPPSDVAPEPRAQLRQPRLVRHQGPIAAVDVVRGQRLEARGRRNVAARRERAAAALLLLRQLPGQIEQQSRSGTFSPRSDVAPPPGLEPLS